MLGELTPREIEDVLQHEVIARLGCHAEGMTYVVPITYAYRGGALFGRTTEGLKLRMMRANPAVCVEVDHMDNLRNWRSVVAWGRFEELSGAEAASAVGLLVQNLAPLLPSMTAIPGRGALSRLTVEIMGTGAVLFRITLDKKTGRYEKA